MNRHRPHSALALVAAFAATLAGCASLPPALPPPAQDQFFAALASHCGADGSGAAYRGMLVSTDPRDKDWQGRAMIAHWADCSEDRVAIAFHVEEPSSSSEAVGHETPSSSEAVGLNKTPSSSEAEGQQTHWNRSRTWIVTRLGAHGTGAGLRLKHDHRHADGSADAVTFYGGDTTAPGTARVQDFPVDGESIALFEREGLAASLTNVWRIEVDPQGTPGGHFTYQLTRANDPSRKFRVAFDFDEAVEAPEAAWGW